ncbi:MAG: c-type cytochrome [Methylococcaceae bacterium]|nr:c-type cytochrome [Methylococcaceae bacterium]
MHNKTFRTLALFSILIFSYCESAKSDESDKNTKPSNTNKVARSETLKEYLGKLIFFDTNLSSPAGQSCSSCHTPNFAFTEPNQEIPTSEGVVAGRFGKRNAPTVMYAQFSPPFHYDANLGSYVGGQFLDGRAATLDVQAKAPFLGAIEMANPNVKSVIKKIKKANYAPLFFSVYGLKALSSDNNVFNLVADAIAAYERTQVFGSFSSKYDAYLAGNVELSPLELQGLQVFEDPGKGNCAACHSSRPAADGTPPLFTDFTYENLGIPRNPANPFYRNDPKFNPDGWNFVDNGLGAVVGASNQNGKFRVPTLRNLARTAPYFHNGYFSSLHAVVDFYNTRDVKPACADVLTNETQANQNYCWPIPEVSDNVNHAELGRLGLTDAEVDAIVAFLNTLEDGYQ